MVQRKIEPRYSNVRCNGLLGSERNGAGHSSLRSLTIADDNYVREDKKDRAQARK
jgi:hypothetical protein